MGKIQCKKQKLFNQSKKKSSLLKNISCYIIKKNIVGGSLLKLTIKKN
jgi:hypothetical protein